MFHVSNSMKRLLLYFSYIGTRYRGIQRLFHPKKGKDLSSIQGVLEYGLIKTLRLPGCQLYISSRTDTGVHALESTAHVDIDEAQIQGIYCPEKICQNINFYLEKNSEDIRVRKIIEVDPEFHCRYNAASRSYCYRIAVFRSDDIFDGTYSQPRMTGELPISDIWRCQVIPQPFNVTAVSRAFPVFLGTWDFRSFMMPSRETKSENFPQESFIKTIYRVSLSKVTPEKNNGNFDPISSKLDYYDLNFESSGFLRRQVRRMVGSLVGVGQGIFSSDKILHMLQNPSASSWDNAVDVASADGLFLKSVNYKDVPVVRGPYP